MCIIQVTEQKWVLSAVELTTYWIESTQLLSQFQLRFYTIPCKKKRKKSERKTAPGRHFTAWRTYESL